MHDNNPLLYAVWLSVWLYAFKGLKRDHSKLHNVPLATNVWQYRALFAWTVRVMKQTNNLHDKSIFIYRALAFTDLIMVIVTDQYLFNEILRRKKNIIDILISWMCNDVPTSDVFFLGRVRNLSLHKQHGQAHVIALQCPNFNGGADNYIAETTMLNWIISVPRFKV